LRPEVIAFGARRRIEGNAMDAIESYEKSVDVLERELQAILGVLGSLSDQEWMLRTNLDPVDPSLPRWSLFELAGHLDISIGLTSMLIADPRAGQVGRDRVSFFISPRSEVAPVVYDYA
jgi:hypothetical protein